VYWNTFLGKESKSTQFTFLHYEGVVQIWHGNGVIPCHFCIGCLESIPNGITSSLEIGWLLLWKWTENKVSLGQEDGIGGDDEKSRL
jgi:hypothetical protein